MIVNHEIHFLYMYIIFCICYELLVSGFIGNDNAKLFFLKLDIIMIDVSNNLFIPHTFVKSMKSL